MPGVFPGQREGPTVSVVLLRPTPSHPMASNRSVRATSSGWSGTRRSDVSLAVQLAEFDRDHRFCGRCGRLTAPSPVEHARVCTGCGATIFPRLSPAVIVLVERGDECLLARSPRFPPGVYSAIAGFIEPGETAEHAVERELAEECGDGDRSPLLGLAALAVSALADARLPATHEGGEVRIDGAEVEDAGGFAVDALPPLPPPGTIARRLIGEFADRVSAPGARRSGTSVIRSASISVSRITALSISLEVPQPRRASWCTTGRGPAHNTVQGPGQGSGRMRSPPSPGPGGRRRQARLRPGATDPDRPSRPRSG